MDYEVSISDDLLDTIISVVGEGLCDATVRIDDEVGGVVMTLDMVGPVPMYKVMDLAKELGVDVHLVVFDASKGEVLLTATYEVGNAWLAEEKY